jgi:hypothetical protein
MAAGEFLHMSAQVYLLFGIPLTVVFQLLVRREPVKDLWVRGGPDLSVRTVSFKLAVPLSIVPFYHLIVSIAKAQGIGHLLYAVAAIVGAGTAAYAFEQFQRRTWIDLELCVATAGLIGTLIFVAHAFHAATLSQPTGVHLRPNVLFGLDSFCYAYRPCS